jgi:hypothetical protein
MLLLSQSTNPILRFTNTTLLFCTQESLASVTIIDGVKVSFISCTFFHSITLAVSTSQGLGGGVHVGGSCRVALARCVFIGCRSARAGAVYLNAGVVAASMEDVMFLGCVSTLGVGG